MFYWTTPIMADESPKDTSDNLPLSAATTHMQPTPTLSHTVATTNPSTQPTTIYYQYLPPQTANQGLPPASTSTQRAGPSGSDSQYAHEPTGKHSCISKEELPCIIRDSIKKAFDNMHTPRRRAPKRKYDSFSDSQDSSSTYSSDSDSTSAQSESDPSLEKSPTRAFLYDGDTYIYWDDKIHEYLDTNRIRWEGEVVFVKWHPNKRDAFCLLKETPPTNPAFITPQLGHQYIMDSLHLNKSNISPGPNRKCFDTTFGPDCGVFNLLNLIKDKEKEINHSLLLDDIKQATERVPNDLFKTISMANFSEGWSFSTHSYSEWAKDEVLNVEEVSMALDLTYTAEVSSTVLKGELTARNELINFISGLRLLELFSASIEDKPKSLALIAISQHFLPTLKNLVINWMAAKMLVRKKVLKNSTKSAAKQLLKSSLWDKGIFPTDVINDLKEKGSQRSIFSMVYGKPFEKYPSEEYSKSVTRRRMNRPSRDRYRKEYSRSDYNSSYRGQSPSGFTKSKYKKDKNARKYKKSGDRSKKDEGPTVSKNAGKKRKTPKSSSTTSGRK